MSIFVRGKYSRLKGKEWYFQSNGFLDEIVFTKEISANLRQGRIWSKILRGETLEFDDIVLRAKLLLWRAI